MALPREPRQKMINIMYLVLTAILALNVSAEVINAFRVVDTSLRTSNDNIAGSNKTLYESLAGKLNDPKQNQEKVKEWNDKALKAKALSAEIDTYINGLKQQLKEGAGLRIVDGKEDFKADNLDASTRLFETNGRGKELQAKLDGYKNSMLSIDPEIKKQFQNNFPVSTDPPVSQEGGKKDFTTSFFHMTPTIAALTMLSKFQNNVKNAESQIVTYCHNQIGAVEVHMDQANILVGQNSNYLMPGQELVVTAGVGAYSSTVKSSITVNGSPINMVAGQGEYKTTVSGAGNHTIEVNGSFIGEDGKPVPVHKTIEYTVGTPGGAAVMLDKMNVFYIGVPNPVTVSSGTGWDKTKVSMSGGTLTSAGGPGKYTVSVSTVGKSSITVNADGKASTYEFRVKRIPDPIFKVGPSAGGRMQSVVFKNQQFCRAELENFDFDARFSVISATVYFAGANFANVQTATINGSNLGALSAQLAKCIPGTSVTFDNVKVQGPDGTVRVIQGPGFILF
ncbi:MAG: gldM [Chitinophagaceae bacterium]|nr:gldM [Chitinophagaceae bacterium]